ncbi:spermidine/putrescine ABC transporter ATP-binding protein [Eubacteriales bacterium]|nr:spermidine/putrescine ABC transporter ATP-binding protein [Eubacteriales bacterium]GKH62041.1 spermidine/putrescine ABC transporter ATP-binding protein [Eubacteriales bacterium]SFJ13240.1 NitT/TauT family transport system ATP-binding protein [Ruminococcaceae bacterium D5]
MSEQNIMVQVSNLALTYQSAEGEIEAIRDLSFSVADGEFVSVIGPSGCGKSTLLSIIAGLLSPTAGEIRLAGDGSIGYMLQKDSLFPWRTIRRNVLLGAEIKGGGLRAAEEYADSLLKTYGLWEFRDCFPGQLSGGMRQRAALIRTLAVRPQLLLLDEAFSALDYQTRLAVADDIYSIIRREGKTAMMVTHDISEAVSLSDRVIVLTKRPAVIKSIYDIRFAAGRKSPLQCREEPEFRGYFNQIWRDIDVHV